MGPSRFRRRMTIWQLQWGGDPKSQTKITDNSFIFANRAQRVSLARA